MEIKGTGFCYNLTTGGTSTPDWSAEIGQGRKKLMNAPGAADILNGMLYYKVDDINNIEAILNKGNRTAKPLPAYLPDYSIVLASVIKKVSVNGVILPNVEFIMFVIKDERTLNNSGNTNVHYGRRTLKFPDKATYQGSDLNSICIDAITQQLGCQNTGSWIVTDINFEEDVLALTALVVDPNNPHNFADKRDRDDTIKRLKYNLVQQTFKPSTYSGDLSPIILYGPPGTGKTFIMQQDYVSKFDAENRFVITFHQSFSYEEFVEGLKPILDVDEDIKYTIEQGVFRKACERAVQVAGYANLKECINDTFSERKNKFDQAISDKNIVLLCIDEINRGNVVAIFGDLISLIEGRKRLGAFEREEMIVTLPYSKDKFGVPANLLIVSTMNTADRSIQLLDSAFRRRFKFKEFLPNYSVFNSDNVAVLPYKNQARKILYRINARIRCLLDKDNQIGHSYLMHVESEEDIFNAMVSEIIPLLEEYFYNDIAKVRFVLYEDDNTKYPFYMKDNVAKAAFDSYISNNDMEIEEKNFYHFKCLINNYNDYASYLKHLLGEPE